MPAMRGFRRLGLVASAPFALAAVALLGVYISQDVKHPNYSDQFDAAERLKIHAAKQLPAIEPPPGFKVVDVRPAELPAWERFIAGREPEPALYASIFAGIAVVLLVSSLALGWIVTGFTG